MNRNNLERALELAERGWRVMPVHTVYDGKCDCGRNGCPSPAKHPRLNDWPRQATTDIDQVRRWWTEHPAANVGIATGRQSGLVVIDVDTRHGGYDELMRLYELHGQPPAGPVAYTGGGGYHLYYAHPGGKVLSRSIAPGIDCKADGGMVVAPPSFHASGTQYEWCETDLNLPAPTLPEWLLLLVMSDRDGEQPADAPPLRGKIRDGDRNKTLASLGGTMRRRGFGQEAIFRALSAENANSCENPLGVDEVARIAASVARYEPEEGIVIVSGKTGPGRSGNGHREPPEPRTYTMAELKTMQLPPMRWAVQDMIPVGLTLLCGRLKLGKSWLALGLACAIAEGGIALAKVPVEDGEVLMLSYEDSQRRLQGRMITLLGEAVQWPERLHVAPTGCWPTRDQGGLEAIDAWLGQHPAAQLVVIDTLQRFRGGSGVEGDKNAYAADYQVSAELQELAMKHGVAILVIHHYRKSLAENDWVDQISGTNGIAGAADTLLGFERRRGEDDAILRVTGRDIRDAEWAMRFDPQQYGWMITGTAEDLIVSQEATEFVEAVRCVGNGSPAHYKQIAQHMGKKFNTVYQMGKRLAERGHVASLGQGLFGPLSIAVKAVKTGDVGAVLDSEMTNYPLTASGPPCQNFVDSVDRPLTAPLSKDSESKTGHFDSFDRQTENVTSILARRGLAQTPDIACATCHEKKWLPRALGGFVCGTCQPWVRKVGSDGVGPSGTAD